jgi:metallo-beta-lactamase family protein
MKMSISFLGAAQNVTGSRYLLEHGGLRILVDCGLYQEREFLARNWDRFPVPPKSIDLILLTHAHLDHSGFLPRLVRNGFRGKVYSTQATCEIAKIALLDSARLLTEDAEFKRKRHAKEGRKGPYPEVPLYTEKDAYDSMPLCTPVRYEEPVTIADGIEATYHDAGHILGASHVSLTVEDAGVKRTILFSGDIGRWDKPILRDPTVLEEADYVIMESTYGNRDHEDPKDIDAMLEDVVRSTGKRGGNICIPSFAIGRTQEVLYHLNELLVEDRIPSCDVFIDSPMAVRVTEVFKHHRELFDQEMLKYLREGHSPFSFPELKMVTTVKESKAINAIKKGALIIAGSGMCTGGRIKHHLFQNISRPESTVLFVGYQAIGTLGRHIVDGAREVRIFGQKHQVKAKITQIHGFSAHADRGELLRWVSGLKAAPRSVFVTHGEPEAAKAFADLLKQEKGWSTSVPQYEDRVELD